MRQILKLLCLFSLIFSLNATAAWYTAQGNAAIVDGDVKGARESAINDAIRNALLESGASIRISQTSFNGTLTYDNINLRSQSQVKKVTVISEQRTSNSVSVTAKIFIDKNVIVCDFGHYKKSILPIPIRYVDNYAYQGSAGIDNINEVISTMLYEGISRSNAVMIKPPMPVNVHLVPTANSLTSNLQNNLDNLARVAKTQYVIYGSIRSVSASDVGNNFLTKILYTQTRSIDFNIAVYDVYSKNILFSKNYSGESDWDFKQGERIDLRSNRFINSSYGARLKQLVDIAVEDIIGELHCLPLKAIITNIDGDDIIINEGSKANIRVGDKFSVQHRSKISTADGDNFVAHDTRTYEYEVISVYPDSAKLRPIDYNDSLVNPRVDDLVTSLSTQ